MRKSNKVSKEIGQPLLVISTEVAGRSIAKNVFDARGVARQKMVRVLEGEIVGSYEILKVRADGRRVVKDNHPLLMHICIS